jgi:hemolysin D
MLNKMNSVATTVRTADELAFLPAALEIQESPPNPAGRMLMWVVIGIVLFAVAWASLGHMDIVAVAPGKLIPSDRVKIIQPLATGQVRAIHVRDGQKVRAGQVLIELDPTLAQADRDRLIKQRSDDQVSLARQRAFAAWLQSGRMPTGELAPGLQRTFFDQLIAEHRAKLAAIDQALERRRSEKQATAMLVERGERTLPLISERAASVAKLASDNLVAKNSHLEIEQERIEAEQDLAAQRANLQAIVAGINELREQRASIHAEAQRATSQAIEDLENRVSALLHEVLKAKTITGQQALTSPVDGVVQQLKVHTIGGVVTPAEPLMIIVPDDQPLEVEAMILNKDIGFIADGQVATVKVDAFPFTRYGSLSGRLTTVSKDATQDEHLGLIYASRVRLAKTSIQIGEREIDLSPGMAVSVEIKTGRRRLIEYFLSPLVQAAGESVRER